ncbi:MAG: DUF6350 family protein [Jatrophihabitantaceae bacterium]
MSSADQQHPPGWLTQFRHGVVSGVGLLLIAVGCCAIATFAAWFMPGADTAPATSALKAAALAVLAGAHGGVVLAGTPVTLTPLLVTGLLGWLVAGHARRQGSWSGFAGLSLGYTVASAVLAGWSRLGSTYAPVGRSALAALLFMLVVGGLARSAELLWARLPARWRRVSRAAALVAAGYLVAGSLLSAGMLLAHFSEAVALQRQLAPGAAGLPVALLAISATPNAALAGVSYLTGPGFDIGAQTSVSALAVSSGRLPVFPLLAGLPLERPAAVAGSLAIMALALLAGWALLRTVSAPQTEQAEQPAEAVRPARGWTHRLGDCAAAAALAGLLLAVLTGLAAGDLGTGTLRGIGATWWAVGLAVTLLGLLAAALWLGVELLLGRLAERGGPALYLLRSEPDTEPALAAAEAHEQPHSQEPERVTEPAARSRNAS